jgi:protein TonB
MATSYAQVFEELEGEDKTELKTNEPDWTCGFPVGTPPQFPGGEDSLKAFLHRNLIFPLTDTCGGFEKIWIGFSVEVSGKVSQVHVIKGTCIAFTQEILRVFSFMPDWIPAVEFGKSVEVKFRLPITFSRK